MTVPRPKQHLVSAGRLYPGAWRQFDAFRAARGIDLPRWPDYVYAPLAAAYAIVCADAGVARLGPGTLERLGDVGRLGALAAWRVTQGVYRFDPDLYAAVVATPLAGDLPDELLRHLPEWCVYVETPGLTWLDAPLHGAFAHLEWDANSGTEELRLLLDGEATLSPVPIHLTGGALLDGVRAALEHALVQANGIGMPTFITRLAADELRRVVEPIMSLLLYLCSEAAEIGDGARAPTNPQPVRAKGAWRLFPAERVTEWAVGVRLGAALRRAQARADAEPAGGTHASPRPHVRRAHWHTYVMGSRAAPLRVLRWLPPIPVRVEDLDGLPVVVRPVPPGGSGKKVWRGVAVFYSRI